MSTASDHETEIALKEKRVAFLGRLGGVTKREAQQIVRQQGGVPVDLQDPHIDLVIIGADELDWENQEELVSEDLRDAAAQGQLEIISETQLWQHLGLVDNSQDIHRLYTPAMLADLLNVSITIVRRWHRRGLIVPTRVVHRLPYFDFQEISTAQRLAQLLAAGASPSSIEKKLEQLARFVPEVERPLAQLSVIVEGKQILLRQGEGLVEPGGQLRIDFGALDDQAEEGVQEETHLAGRLRVPDPDILEAPHLATAEEILSTAADLEDQGSLDIAAEMYRTALAAAGPDADICFRLAELLYRMGDISAARERYYMAIEIDEDYVESRANLGCVLVETGQLDLAVAAFQGALEYHSDYPDVHYHLARVLDELDQHEEAGFHWREFLGLAPDSPWADEARERLKNAWNEP